MLEKYLQTQKDSLNLMQQRQFQLQQQADAEQQRLIKLSEHIASLEKPEQMACSLSLKNLAGLKDLMSCLQQEQQERINQATDEVLRQQQACRKQAVYNQGITELLDARAKKEAVKIHRQEQKVQDELSMQLFLRQQNR